jgi:hypothetical protein
MTLDELAALGEWSKVTVRRYLKRWGALTSYNRNGRYYVLRDIPRFDRCGLWSYDGVRFSRFGNLTRTIIAIVGASDSGMAASDISVLLGYKVHPVLSRLTRRGALRREHHPGRNIYFSAKPEVFDVQRKARRSRDAPPADALSAEAAIMLLVEKIKQPHASIGELADAIGTRGIMVDMEAAEKFLERHGLQKKT